MNHTELNSRFVLHSLIAGVSVALATIGVLYNIIPLIVIFVQTGFWFTLSGIRYAVELAIVASREP